MREKISRRYQMERVTAAKHVRAWVAYAEKETGRIEKLSAFLSRVLPRAWEQGNEWSVMENENYSAAGVERITSEAVAIFKEQVQSGMHENILNKLRAQQ